MRILYIVSGQWGTTFHIHSKDPKCGPVFLKPINNYWSCSEILFHRIIKRNGKKTVLEFIDAHTGSFKVDLGKINIEILKALTRIDVSREEYRDLVDLNSKELLKELIVKEYSSKVSK